HGSNAKAVELPIAGQDAVSPARQPSIGANPERAITADPQGPDVMGRQTLIAWRFPRDGLHAVEAKQTDLGTKPEISVWRLHDCVDGAFRKTITDLPRRVRVLTRVERRIQGKRARSRGEQQADERGAESRG